MVPLRPDEKSPFGESAARIVHAPGHADNQLVLHDEVRGILFAADHLLLGITPNIGLWPESEPHPLARYLESLEGMLGLGADLVLPGHGPVFHDLDGRIGELIPHHEERLERMRREIEGSSKTPYEVSRVVFRGTLTLHQRCFALAETLAHLDHLVLEGRVERIENETVVFRAAKNRRRDYVRTQGRRYRRPVGSHRGRARRLLLRRASPPSIVYAHPYDSNMGFIVSCIGRVIWLSLSYRSSKVRRPR